QHLAALQDQVAGTLALAASTIPGEHILPGILGDFRRRYPGVNAIVTISDSAEVVEQAAARQCDVGFIGAEIKRRSLALHKLVDDELVLLAPVDHPLTKRQAVKLSEVEGQPFIQREEGSGTQRSTEALLRRVGFNLPRTACPLRVSSSQAVIAAVEAGLGLAFVSRLAAARSLQCGACRTVSLDGRSFMRGIYYTYLEKHQHSRPAQAFLTFLEGWSKERA
ncbi:MAG: LysR family transcriptional regulator, partial [Euryarchaeota archaeon]|nr:LysR family transcriptional regulator [Euryarchaeota archaeon]